MAETTYYPFPHAFTVQNFDACGHSATVCSGLSPLAICPKCDARIYQERHEAGLHSHYVSLSMDAMDFHRTGNRDSIQVWACELCDTTHARHYDEMIALLQTVARRILLEARLPLAKIEDYLRGYGLGLYEPGNGLLCHFIDAVIDDFKSDDLPNNCGDCQMAKARCPKHLDATVVGGYVMEEVHSE